jgi:putative ABC transport system ATP-binding protein
MNHITIKGVTKNLGKKQVLRGINLAIKKGEIMALVGPSGSGKSTLLRCLNRLTEIDAGEIKYEGQDIREIPPVDLRRQLSLVHQESVMLPGTVYDNIAYGPSLKGRVERDVILRALMDAGLPVEFLDKDASKLSGGEKKRVALARALALHPQVLLLDEPTSGVDPKNVERIERTIIDFSRNRGLTVLWVTHYVEQAIRVSTRIANLKNGRITTMKKTQDFQWEVAY